jgi:mannobiose 2-epimerase
MKNRIDVYAARPAVMILILSFFSCNLSRPEFPFREEEYWKKQGLEDIISYWTRQAADREHGGFHTTLDRQWKPYGDSMRYPSMVARHLFGYSAAYLMSGDPAHLETAKELKDYLLNTAWDKTHGGFYDMLTVSGEAARANKNIFVQVYSITGLVMYYFITLDPEVLIYIREANSLLETRAWDPVSGGYFDELNPGWTVEDSSKSFSSVITPVSGYLLYLYLATRDEAYLDQAKRIMNTVLDRMRDKDSGWILESFDRDWNYKAPPPTVTEINTGHNIETAWMLLRLHLLRPNERFKEAALSLSEALHRFGMDTASGVWFASFAKKASEGHADYSYWWIQEYGMMFDLCLFKGTGRKEYLKLFDLGAAFWDKYYIDREYGDTYLGVFLDGRIKDGVKANRFKASYHNMETSLLNYLYTALWVNRRPAQLHFNLTSAADGDQLYPLPIEETDYSIRSVTLDGNNHTETDAGKKAVRLPALKGAKLVVQIGQ